MTARGRHAVLAVYVVILLGLTLAPAPSVATAFSGLDKWVHAGLFDGLVLLLSWNVRSLKGLAVAVVISLIAAALIEFAQKQLPYRTADLSDFEAGVGGVVVGALVAAILLKRGRSATSSVER